MRGATGIFFRVLDDVVISIHAPHAGSDWIVANTERGKSYFNPRSPCGERRGSRADRLFRDYFNPRSPCGERRASGDAIHRAVTFQSTLPMRGATSQAFFEDVCNGISIHAPHAGSDDRYQLWRSERVISIHAPHAGSDARETSFLVSEVISIHAPHAGSDDSCLRAASNRLRFQSTLPMRGATKSHRHVGAGGWISIHAPHAGSDPLLRRMARCPTDFNPRSPCGERHV